MFSRFVGRERIRKWWMNFFNHRLKGDQTGNLTFLASIVGQHSWCGTIVVTMSMSLPEDKVWKSEMLNTILTVVPSAVIGVIFLLAYLFDFMRHKRRHTCVGPICFLYPVVNYVF